MDYKFSELGKNYKELHENKFLDKDEYKDFLEVTKLCTPCVVRFI